MSERLELVLHNDIEALGTAAARLGAFLETLTLPCATIYAIDLAFEEIVSNTIKYGYVPGRPDRIEVVLTVDAGTARMRISDRANAFDPLAADAPDLNLSTEDRPVGGLGIHLVKNLARGMEYRRDGGQNILTLDFADAETTGPRTGEPA